VTEPHEVLNALSRDGARDALLRCCKSTRWAEGMLARRPFESTPALLADAEATWNVLVEDDYLEAFRGHPNIGASLSDLEARFRSTASWSASEQGAVQHADRTTLEALGDGNVAYEKKFGFIFIVCATGRTAPEMLALLRERLDNERARELDIAAREQAKITRIRLEKLA
jgi:2-oxo-4-hydroxy-4-carboxy-5-ureidoimidazoline decarboxylase